MKWKTVTLLNACSSVAAGGVRAPAVKGASATAAVEVAEAVLPPTSLMVTPTV